MDSKTFEATVFPQLIEWRERLRQISAGYDNANVILLAESVGLFDDALYAFHKVMRKLPKDRGLVLVLESMGGSIDVAYSIAQLCRERFGSFTVIPPFMAKSAATLLVLAADKRVLTSSTLLGPTDPQVRHPEKRIWFPAHSIREALAEAEATSDPFVKMSMADKLDPFLIGAYKASIGASVQYMTEVVESWSVPNKGAIIDTFTSKYKSHGYPIGRKVLDQLGVPYCKLPDSLEDTVCSLHEGYSDLLSDDDAALVILSECEYLFEIQPEKGDHFRTKGAFPKTETEAKPQDTETRSHSPSTDGKGTRTVNV